MRRSQTTQRCAAAIVAAVSLPLPRLSGPAPMLKAAATSTWIAPLLLTSCNTGTTREAVIAAAASLLLRPAHFCRHAVLVLDGARGRLRRWLMPKWLAHPAYPAPAKTRRGAITKRTFARRPRHIAAGLYRTAAFERPTMNSAHRVYSSFCVCFCFVYAFRSPFVFSLYMRSFRLLLPFCHLLDLHLSL